MLLSFCLSHAGKKKMKASKRGPFPLSPFYPTPPPLLPSLTSVGTEDMLVTFGATLGGSNRQRIPNNVHLDCQGRQRCCYLFPRVSNLTPLCFSLCCFSMYDGLLSHSPITLSKETKKG